MSAANLKSPKIPKTVLEDMERAIALALAGEHDQSFEKRIRAEARRVRERVFRKHGVLDIGTTAIRELRDA